jgi:Tol biopolymer transport system component
VYDLASGAVRQVTNGPGTNEQPVFAPNGRHILFFTTRWGKKHLAIVNIKGTNVHRITEVGNNDYATWSAARAQ